MTDAEEKLNKIREGGRKGGQAKTKKGFALMSPEQIKAAQLKAAEARKRNKHEQTR